MRVTMDDGVQMNEDTYETEPVETVLYDDEPCRLSYGSPSNAGSEFSTEGKQVIKLFCGPDVVIPQGSKIEVMRQGNTFSFGRSDAPAVYGSHREYTVTKWEKTR